MENIDDRLCKIENDNYHLQQRILMLEERRNLDYNCKWFDDGYLLCPGFTKRQDEMQYVFNRVLIRKPLDALHLDATVCWGVIFIKIPCDDRHITISVGQFGKRTTVKQLLKTTNDWCSLKTWEGISYVDRYMSGIGPHCTFHNVFCFGHDRKSKLIITGI